MKKLLMLLFFISFNAFSQECMIGEIKTFSGNFVPTSWRAADGSILSIAQNQALFSILGTTYGGDGKTTFALPNLNGRSIIGDGQFNGQIIQTGTKGGSDNIQIFNSNLPTTTSNFKSLQIIGSESLVKNLINGNENAISVPLLAEKDTQILNPGANMPISSRNPYLALKQLICVEGIYPSRY